MGLLHLIGAMLLSFLAMRLGTEAGVERSTSTALGVFGVILLLGALVTGDDGPFRISWVVGLSLGMFIHQTVSRKGARG